MNPREYEIMASVESDHWWYRSLRDCLEFSLRRYGQALPEKPNILDAGCGTGQNLCFLNSLFRVGYLGGFDFSERAVEYAKSKCPAADIYQSDIRQPELHCEEFDIVVSCDVLYIPGFEASTAGLLQIIQKMRPGGLFLVNLPAYNWLRSDHDLAIQTSERYVASQVKNFLQRLGLEPMSVTYRLCALFPLVVASRLPSIMRPSSDAHSATSALKPASQMSNMVFGQYMRWENRLIGCGLRMPFGSSVFAVGRKPHVAR